MIQDKVQNRTCANCVRGSAVIVNNDILCREKGIVSSDYTCGKHRFSPETKSYKDMNYKCINCDNFIINYQEGDIGNQGLGVCQLFSVREFNGFQKKACSKFIHKKKAISHSLQPIFSKDF